MGDILLLILSLAIILAGAEIFTNGVEWLGKCLKLGEGAVGSVLAAVGTALPETMVPVIAVLFNRETGGAEVGVGAILGAPFMLGTLALFVLGLSVLLSRRSNKPMRLKQKILVRDLRFFILVYTLAIIASFLNHTLQSLIVLILVASYGFYVYQTIKESRGKAEHAADLPPFYFYRKTNSPGHVLVLGQIGVSLLIIMAGAKIFVGSVQQVSVSAGIPVLVLSLIITPVATELPEKFNSILWCGRGKDTLALGNITGAMVFQSSVIPALGIALTPWILEPLALASALLVLLSAYLQYLFLRKYQTLYPAGLLLGGVFYAIFMFLVIKGI